MKTTDSAHFEDYDFAPTPFPAIASLIHPLLIVLFMIEVVVFVKFVEQPLLLWMMIGLGAVPVLVVGIALSASWVRNFKLTGSTLIVEKKWTSKQVELAGLQSVHAASFSASPRNLKIILTDDNEFELPPEEVRKIQENLKVYVINSTKAVLLRWPDKCVVVSPEDRDWFIQQVRKRAGI